MNSAASLKDLIEALRCLPGVGPKSAQRMAYHMLQRDRGGAEKLAHALANALVKLRACQKCNSYSESELCELCESNKRDASLLCVVESPADLLMVEQSQSYRGLYFVLMGRLSPLDGIGPKEIHLDKLIARAQEPNVNEVILATNFTVEGEATAHYIGEILRVRHIKVSRIARGLPVGGELEYVDSGTLAQALIERRGL